MFRAHFNQVLEICQAQDGFERWVTWPRLLCWRHLGLLLSFLVLNISDFRMDFSLRDQLSLLDQLNPPPATPQSILEWRWVLHALHSLINICSYFCVERTPNRKGGDPGSTVCFSVVRFSHLSITGSVCDAAEHSLNRPLVSRLTNKVLPFQIVEE